MQCPFCNHDDSRVLESRSKEGGKIVRRRRECLSCQHRFTTYERIDFFPITILKRDGKKEAFDRTKLLRGLMRACEKTTMEPHWVEKLVDQIELDLQQRGIKEAHSNEIGELVLKYLRHLNEVAYVRFASVYRKFQGIKDFIETLEDLQTQEQGEFPHSNFILQATSHLTLPPS